MRRAAAHGPSRTGARRQGLSALAVYLTQYQLLPYQRRADLLGELAGIAIAPASVYTAVTQATRRLAAPVQAIQQARVHAPVVHADETGLRVDGTLQWLHVFSTATHTAYFADPKRGGEALSAFGLLEQFSGTLVHDHWSAYARRTGAHGFCNAHHRRALIGHRFEAILDHGERVNLARTNPRTRISHAQAARSCD